MISSLNETTFEEILTQCGQHSNYEGVIVLSHRNDVRNFVDEIMRIHSYKRIPYLKDNRTSYHCSVIRFHNGSSIELTTPDAMRKGDKYHTVLVHESIRNPEFLDCVYRFEKQYEADILKDAMYAWQEDYLSKQRQYYRTYELGDWGYTPPKPVDPIENVTDTEELDSFLNGFSVNP